jgi:CrcB protein
MGMLAGWLARFGAHGEGWRLLLGVGVLGGFTTFSSFSLEFALLVERGTLGAAAVYVAASLAAGFAGLFAGLYAMRVLA